MKYVIGFQTLPIIWMWLNKVFILFCFAFYLWFQPPNQPIELSRISNESKTEDEDENIFVFISSEMNKQDSDDATISNIASETQQSRQSKKEKQKKLSSKPKQANSKTTRPKKKRKRICMPRDWGVRGQTSTKSNSNIMSSDYKQQSNHHHQLHGKVLKVVVKKMIQPQVKLNLDGDLTFRKESFTRYELRSKKNLLPSQKAVFAHIPATEESDCSADNQEVGNVNNNKETGKSNVNDDSRCEGDVDHDSSSINSDVRCADNEGDAGCEKERNDAEANLQVRTEIAVFFIMIQSFDYYFAEGKDYVVNKTKH